MNSEESGAIGLLFFTLGGGVIFFTLSLLLPSYGNNIFVISFLGCVSFFLIGLGIIGIARLFKD
jgi:hypothetical protein